MKYNLWGHTDRPWGYEIRCTFTDDKGVDYCECLTFKAPPTQKELDSRIATTQARVEYAIANPPVVTQIKPTVTEVKEMYLKLSSAEQTTLKSELGISADKEVSK
jgi:hypothetical protein